MNVMKLIGKKLTNAVVLGLMLAAPYAASAEEITVADGQVLEGQQTVNSTIKGTDGTENITFKGDGTDNFSVYANNGGMSSVKDVNNIAINGSWGGDNSGFYTNGASSKIEISANGNITADVSGKK